MNVIVSGLPFGRKDPSDQSHLRALHRRLVNCLTQDKTLGIESENDVDIWFPADLMYYGLGKFIRIDVTGPSGTNSQSHHIQQAISLNLAKAVQNKLPQARVRCLVDFRRNTPGFTELKPLAESVQPID